MMTLVLNGVHSQSLRRESVCELRGFMGLLAIFGLNAIMNLQICCAFAGFDLETFY